MALEEDIEIIDLPTAGRFKVVQIVVDGHRPVMVCGSEDRFHKDLLTDYLHSIGVYPKIKVIISREGTTKKLPLLEGERYKVVGMGEAEISSPKFFQLPYGDSRDYEIGPSKEFKEKLKQQFAGWEF